MADGSRKPIEQVVLGDQVHAVDPVTGESGPRHVVATIVGVGQKNLVDIAVTGDHSNVILPVKVTATEGHPFWVASESAWTDAGDLTAGDRLRSVGDKSVNVRSLVRRVGLQKVYNLTVSGLHTYFVLAGEISILVHNSGSCPSWSSSHERAGDLAGKYTQGQNTRDPASQWYHEELSNSELLNGINNAADGDGIVVSRGGKILGGHHRWDELQARIKDGRIAADTPIRIDLYGGE